MVHEKCLQCGKQLSEEKKKHPTVRYCSKRCKDRASTARHYAKYKSDYNFMEKRRIDLKRIRQNRKENGLCPRCGQEMLYETTVECSDCYVNRKSRMR